MHWPVEAPHDIQKVQRAILQTDEYANFNY